MTSKFGYLPHEIKSTANGVFFALDDNVIYNEPIGIHSVSAIPGTANTVLLTPADVLGGYIIYGPDADGTYNLVLPTAAELVKAMNGATTGTSIRFIVRNPSSDTVNTDLVVSDGITAFPGDTIRVVETQSGEFLLVFDDVSPGNESAVLYTISSAYQSSS